jgi:hypothetical protein
LATPFLRLKSTGELLSDKCASWSGWNSPWGIARLTPLNGGAYLQKTSAGVLQCQATFAFATKYPNSSIDNFFRIMDLARQAPVDGQGTLFRYRDLEGWVRDVQIWRSPFGDSLTETQDLQRFWHPLHSHYAIPLDLMVPGYLP